MASKHFCIIIYQVEPRKPLLILLRSMFLTCVKLDTYMYLIIMYMYLYYFVSQSYLLNILYVLQFPYIGTYFFLLLTLF